MPYTIEDFQRDYAREYPDRQQVFHLKKRRTLPIPESQNQKNNMQTKEFYEGK